MCSDIQDIIRFPFTLKGKSMRCYCVCKKEDYNLHGASIAVQPNVIKGVSDTPREAWEDFVFNVQLANDKALYSKIDKEQVFLIERDFECIDMH
ncbi:hypothetical protein KUL42_39120 [Alteromonas sp. KUL42]|uniref:hypothetical protein n=1 Tax=Alteromonas sp. KUL42 TaxID=2480797 RepID=UPI0010363134|nr:hypothetical protein [Alteromonas sp. KUL42]TAP31718.1 hypothetical protein EYR97_19715 [Alteromonas sp. KUL42]GEA09151.1 hypothetical protein KUL42_39120 [Alteromonas sp. KUL42]